ncbi:Helix-turn-helix [Rhizobium sp. RU20A]|uniref:helix-turn-helix domain-containing protein n=1 Tax=Rhizobium sp. RU20A TaxID=1907412 RepID=UPI000955AD49|nr:helix-turn-helix transcriptional regulator [Rhizobium sp. RU20A]SIQ22356.1 Helix-turn-helix [Rhizobium sp. RU20A]
MIDSAWFYRQLEARGGSVRDLARFLELDPSSVSRMLRGERKMSAEEQDGIAAYFGLPLADVAARRKGETTGFSEPGQEPFAMGSEMEMVRAIRPEHRSGGRTSPQGSDTSLSFFERIRSKMAGTVTVMPGVDLTEPADPDWARVYDEDHDKTFRF